MCPINLRRIKSSSSKRVYKSPRRRQKQAKRQSRGSHASIAAIRLYTACTCPIDNTVLCLENLLIACVKASFHLAVKRSVPGVKTISSYAPHKQAPTSRRCKPRPSSPKQYSRPGPKSGVRFWRLLTLTLIARPHGVRVPTQAAWVGESNIFANQSPNQELKQCGVQLSNVQNQLSTLSRSGKRSYKRACRRAHKYGQVIYKGRVLKASHCPYVGPTENGRQPKANIAARTPNNGLHIFCYNAGGLGGGMYEELLHYLGESHYTIALIQESKWSHDSECSAAKWICVGTVDPKQKFAGVMVWVRKDLTNPEDVKYEAYIPGRLLRVRFPLGHNTSVPFVCTNTPGTTKIRKSSKRDFIFGKPLTSASELSPNVSSSLRVGT